MKCRCVTHPQPFCLIDVQIYATGTYPQDNVYLYDPVANRWTRKPNLTPTGWQARTAVDAHTGDGKIHITGGLVGRTTYSIYDPKTNTWERGPSLLQGIMCHGMAIDPDSRVWVFGGADTQNNVAQKSMYYLDPGSVIRFRRSADVV